MNQTIPPDYTLGTFNEVIIEKAKLLEKLKENRNDHESLYQAACSGYWLESKKVIDEKVVEFKKALGKTEKDFNTSVDELRLAVEAKNENDLHNFAGFFAFNSQWPLTYPTNQLDDYDRVIDLLSFSVADKVKLTLKEFNCYVRNQWDWNEQFTATNQLYANAYVSGYCAPSAFTASVGTSKIADFARLGSKALGRSL